MSFAPNPLRLLAAFALLAAAAATASVPTGARFGPWQVVSIASASGVSRGDASAMLVQETRAGTLQADWDQGGAVSVSIDIRGCGPDGEDFERGYSLDLDQWLALADGGGGRLRADFSAWLAEARRVCRRRVSGFRLDRIAPAARDFTARLRALGTR